MAAFRRRTTFAVPLVVTIAAGCPSSKKAEPPPPSTPSGPYTNPPEPASWAITMKDMKCLAVENVLNPPPPQEVQCPPGMSGNTAMTMQLRDDGSCIALPGKHVTPCPLPRGQKLVTKLSNVWTIEKRGKDCHAEEDDAHSECPPGVDCNPPRPRTFPCPPGVTEEKPLHVAELPDATCVVVPDGCTDTGCATEKIECPARK